MAFAFRGEVHERFLIFSFKTILNHSVTAKTRFAHSLGFISSSYSKLSSLSSEIGKSKQILTEIILNVYFAAVGPFLAQSGGERTLNSTARNNQLKVDHPMKGGKNISCEAAKYNFRGLVCLKVPHPLLYRPIFAKKSSLSLFRHHPEKGPRMVFSFGPKITKQRSTRAKSEPKVTIWTQKIACFFPTSK